MGLFPFRLARLEEQDLEALATFNWPTGDMISPANNYAVININGSALLDSMLDILLQGGF